MTAVTQTHPLVDRKRLGLPRLQRLRQLCSTLCLWAALALVPGARAQSVSNGFWQAQSVYQVITDRFYDGNPANNNVEGTYDPAGHGGSSVHGGDFKGLEQKLDYIKALGATAIWISPIVLNGNGEFHGYAARDFYKVAPHWGSLADLQHMVQAAHARGLLVINDIVVNHGGDLINSADAGYSGFQYPPTGYTLKYRNSSKTFAPPFDIYNGIYTAGNNALTNLFHNNGNIADFGDDTQVVLGELSGLDDFRTESTYVRTQMAQIYQYWIAQAGFDGFRIDTVKHVEMGFWQNWCPTVHGYAGTNGYPNFFMFGESLDGSEAKVGSYTGTKAGGPFALDSMLDYPLYFNINNVFAKATGATKPIEDHYNAIAANYDPAAQMRLVTFLDNHDQPRFLSSGNANNNTDRLLVALAFLYTARGVPCLYYGTEQAFNGGTDPYNREDMFDGQFKDGPTGVDSFNMTHPLFLWAAKLNNLRRLYPALQLGAHVHKWNDPDSSGLFAYQRRFTNTTPQEVFVILNTSGSAQTLTNRSTSYPAGTLLVNLLNTNETATVMDGPLTPPITLAGTSVKMFLAQSQWQPLDPVVVSNSPAHAATGVPTFSPIVLQFSAPMDTNSVQTNFSTLPPLSGSFAWSAAHDVLTFTTAGTGLPGLANVLVRVTNGVDAASGKTFFAPYQLLFNTAATSDGVSPTVALQTPLNGAIVTGNLPISGTANDNVAVQKVEVQLDSGPWLLAAGTTTWGFTLNTSNFLNGPHLLAARATDTSGRTSVLSTANVRFFNVPGAYVQRLSGGSTTNVVDCSGNTWLRDQAYSVGSFGQVGGSPGYLGNTIVGVCAAAQPLYQRERYSTSSAGLYYQFDCPAGLYETTLLEAETYWSTAGQRLFNVFIQGSQVLTNFDIFAAAGGKNLPLTRRFTNAVTNAQLQVLFTPLVDNARISGIQVRKLADLYSDTDGLPDWWRLAYFGHALGQAGDLSRAADDADSDGASNLTEFLSGTDPLNAAVSPTAPLFSITGLLTAGSDVQVNCSTVTNWGYQLQRRDRLDATSSWVAIGSRVPGNNGVLAFSDDGGATNIARYYRVQAR